MKKVISYIGFTLLLIGGSALNNEHMMLSAIIMIGISIIKREGRRLELEVKYRALFSFTNHSYYDD